MSTSAEPTSNFTNAAVVPPVVSRGNCSTRSDVDVKTRLILHFDGSYLRSRKGLVHGLQGLFCVLALACVTSAGNSGWNSYLLLPLSANLRFFVFVTVFSLFVAVLFIAVFTARLTEAFPLDWSLAELLVHFLLAWLQLVAMALVGAVSTRCLHQSDIGAWTNQQLVLSTVLGCVCVALHVASVVLSWPASVTLAARRPAACRRNLSERSLRSSTTTASVDL